MLMRYKPEILTHEVFCEIYNQLNPEEKKLLEDFILFAKRFEEEDQAKVKQFFYMVGKLNPNESYELSNILQRYGLNSQKIEETLKLLNIIKLKIADHQKTMRVNYRPSRIKDILTPKVKLRHKTLVKELGEANRGFLSLENMKVFAYKLRFFYDYSVVKKFHAPKADFNKGLELKMLSERRKESARRRTVVSRIILGKL